MMKKNIKIVNIDRFFKKNLGKGNSDIAFSFLFWKRDTKEKEVIKMSNLNNLIPLADKHRTTTQMSLQTPVDNLNIVCYPEQLELFTGDIDETVELENEAISMISEEDMFVWMEVHTEKEGKTHFDFTVVVTKNMGKRRRQRINHILKALHILFRKEDAELFKRK